MGKSFRKQAESYIRSHELRHIIHSSFFSEQSSFISFIASVDLSFFFYHTLTTSQPHSTVQDEAFNFFRTSLPRIGFCLCSTSGLETVTQ